MNISAKVQRKAYTEWLSQRKKANGENYSDNTVNSYVSSLSNAPERLKGIELEATDLYEITLLEAFKKVRVLIEGAENFDEVNVKAGNKAFQYALQYYEEFLVQQGGDSFNTEVYSSIKSVDNSLQTSTVLATEAITMDKNIILYGPPGTGKTYNTVAYAIAIIERKSLKSIQHEIDMNGYERVLTRYRTYKDKGQITFTTFHQSYGYEEFIEGIKPKIEIESAEQNGNDVSYEIKAGIFKEFCDQAITPTIQNSNEYGIRSEPTIWKVSLEGARENTTKRDCFVNSRIRVGWDGYGEKITEETDFTKAGGKKILSSFIDEMMIGDIVLVLYDEKTIDAIGVVTGDYEWLDQFEHYKRSRKVKWLVKDIREDIYELNGNTVLTLGSVYRLNRIKLTDVLHILKKHDASSGTTIEENTNHYVFIIDEINRGNISKIFGELITLIEPTKRLGQVEEIKLKLPYSQVEFGVPNNVYILATMNTADRSIARLDTALRRRFHFAELMPNPQFLKGVVVEGIDIAAMLTKINRRIEVLFDREHTIGHAYFMSLVSNPILGNLASIFKNAIIPLLQEYFYEDYHNIQLVLGDNNKNRDEQFIQNQQIDVKELFGNSSEIDLDDEVPYEINEQAFTQIDSYRKIYNV